MGAVMTTDEEQQPVTKGEFYEFQCNHFAHLADDVNVIKGKMQLLVPLTVSVFVTLLGCIISMVLR